MRIQQKQWSRYKKIKKLDDIVKPDATILDPKQHNTYNIFCYKSCKQLKNVKCYQYGKNRKWKIGKWKKNGKSPSACISYF